MTKAHGNKNAELADLLPWYVNGTLDTADMEAIDAALESDPDLQLNLERALEDRAATLELASTDIVPASMSARFDAQLEREADASQHAPREQTAPGFLERAGQWLYDALLGGSNPRLVYAAAAAAIVILLQSGAIVSMFVSAPGSQIDLASGENAGGVADIMFLVQIEPDTPFSKIAAFLEAEDGRILDGPLPGGMYKLGFNDAEGVSESIIGDTISSRGDLFPLVLPVK